MISKRWIIIPAAALAIAIPLLSINVALPATIKVVDGATGKPASGVYVILYLAIRGGVHGQDQGQSLSRIAVTNDAGEAHIGRGITWEFLHGFNRHYSKIILYKPYHMPIIENKGFDIQFRGMTVASTKKQDFEIKAYEVAGYQKEPYLSAITIAVDRAAVPGPLYNKLIGDLAQENKDKKFN